MFLAEGIIKNFIENIDEEDILNIEAIEDDESAYQYIAQLYEKCYGTKPSGAGIYLLRNKFRLGSEEKNIRYVPSGLV